MASDRAQREASRLHVAQEDLRQRRVWLLCGVFFMNTVVTYGIFLWLPKLLQDVSGASGFTLSTITVGAVCRRAHRHAHRRTALRSHRRAALARRGVRA